MLTERQKIALENKIYNLIKESLFEKEVDNKKNSRESNSKRSTVLNKLKNPNLKKSQIAYELWNKQSADEDEKGAARSLFTKKINGKDPDGNPYSFTNAEINSLYNIIGGTE